MALRPTKGVEDACGAGDLVACLAPWFSIRSAAPAGDKIACPTGVFNGAGAQTLLALCLAAAAACAAVRLPAVGGDIVVTPVTHASVQVEHGGKVIHVDPQQHGRGAVLWKKTLCVGGVQISIKAYVDAVELVIRKQPAKFDPAS